MTIEPWVWPAGLGFLGLILGSFIATVVIRWTEERSVSRGRSGCDDCGATLRAHELVPLLSYIVQRGRCSSCGARIHPAHPAIELLALAIGVAAGLAAPGPEGVAGAVFGWLLLTLAGLDLMALWLPNGLNAALALAGIGTGLIGFEPPLIERLIGGVVGFALLWLVASAYRAVRGRVGLGGGDPKLFGAIGLWLGWQALPMVLLIACLVGLAGVALLAIVGRKVGATDRLPFGVMLAFAAFAMWLGQALGLA